MAKKKAKSSGSSKKSSKKSSKNSTKQSQGSSSQAAQAPKYEGCAWCRNDLEDEHRVLSHLMYILFLFAIGFAAIFTVFLFTVVNDPNYEFAGIKALVLIGWAFLFKTFGHRIHVPHH